MRKEMNRSKEEREQREVSKTAVKIGFGRKTLLVNQDLEVIYSFSFYSGQGIRRGYIRGKGRKQTRTSLLNPLGLPTHLIVLI